MPRTAAPLSPEAEHLALLQSYARLQQRVTGWCASHAQARARWEAEQMRLRGEAIRWRSLHAWAAHDLAALQAQQPGGPPAAVAWQGAWAQAEAAGLLCATGCLPFGRAWATAKGAGAPVLCALTQTSCVAPAAAAGSPVQPPAAG